MSNETKKIRFTKCTECGCKAFSVSTIKPLSATEIARRTKAIAHLKTCSHFREPTVGEWRYCAPDGRPDATCHHSSVIAEKAGLRCAGCGEIKPWPECSHGGDRSTCTQCAVTEIAKHAPGMIDVFSSFGARQLAIIERLATCAHELAIASGMFCCRVCGARRKGSSLWYPSLVGQEAKALDRELKASVLRGFRELSDTAKKDKR